MFRALALALSLALPASALATTDVAPAACPVDDEDVDVTILLSTDSLLGHDRDLCPHANVDDDVRGAVSACTSCGFAGTIQEFQREVREDVAAKVKKELTPAKTSWERYANRARILEWSESPAAVVGESWLRAAWSVRLEPRPIAPPLSTGLEKLVRSIPETAADDVFLTPARAIDAKVAAGEITGDDKAVALYVSGSFWRARGELAEAESRYVKALEAAKGAATVTALEDAIARDRASIELESGYLKKALAHFRAAINAGEKVPKAQRPMLAFLAAECARRTGNREEAQRFYKIVQTLDTAASPERAKLVEQGLADTAPVKKSDKPKSKASN